MIWKTQSALWRLVLNASACNDLEELHLTTVKRPCNQSTMHCHQRPVQVSVFIFDLEDDPVRLINAYLPVRTWGRFTVLELVSTQIRRAVTFMRTGRIQVPVRPPVRPIMTDDHDELQHLRNLHPQINSPAPTSPAISAPVIPSNEIRLAILSQWRALEVDPWALTVAVDTVIEFFNDGCEVPLRAIRSHCSCHTESFVCGLKQYVQNPLALEMTAETFSTPIVETLRWDGLVIAPISMILEVIYVAVCLKSSSMGHQSLHIDACELGHSLACAICEVSASHGIDIQALMEAPTPGTPGSVPSRYARTPDGPAEAARMRLHRRNVTRYSPSPTGVQVDYNSDSTDFAAAVDGNSCSDCAIESDDSDGPHDESDYVVVVMLDTCDHLLGGQAFGNLAIPGDHLSDGEQPSSAAHRIITSQLNIAIRPSRIKFHSSVTTRYGQTEVFIIRLRKSATDHTIHSDIQALCDTQSGFNGWFEPQIIAQQAPELADLLGNLFPGQHFQ